MRKIAIVGLVVAALSLLLILPAQAATEEEIEDSIVAGLEFLVGAQDYPGTGAWPGELATTSFAVVKLLDRGYEIAELDPDVDGPFDEDYEYYDNVVAGLDHMFTQASQPAAGEVCFAAGGHETYNTGIAMMAIAASKEPDREATSAPAPLTGQTYMQILQGCVNFFASSQNTDGGWRYVASPQPSDQSNTGYATLGLLYAEDFGCTIPASIKTGLESWINAIQDPVDGDLDDGGSHYTVPPPVVYAVNCLKTGNLLTQMSFVGDTLDVQRVKDAIDYLERHWLDPNGHPGWRGPLHAQAAYCVMKGLESMGIELLDLDNDDIPEYDWFDDMSTVIIDNQNTIDGGWPVDMWGGSRVLATEWALLTLERIAPPPPVLEIPVDIKPTSCPNPLNMKGKGVLPIAILGTEEFDVSQIDPDTIRLVLDPESGEKAVPLRWAIEDVATPYEPYIGKEYCMDCTLEGPDSYMDLTVKFDTQEVVALLGEVGDGDCVVLTVTAFLKEEFGGNLLIGEDVVRIILKGK